jgi:hypothetical protein
MKVEELIVALKLANPDAEIFLQKDCEGNSYAPLYGAHLNGVAVESDGDYDVYDSEWSAYEADMDEAKWESVKRSPRCVVLFPAD